MEFDCFFRQFVLIICKSASPGGALKPTNIESLWIHITCAWFRPEVGFLNHEKMEPAVGILRIPSSSFLKVPSELNVPSKLLCLLRIQF